MKLIKIIDIKKQDICELQKILSNEKVHIYLPFRSPPSYQEVGNAVDITKESSDLIIGPNTEDSVIKFIAEDCGIGLI